MPGSPDDVLTLALDASTYRGTVAVLAGARVLARDEVAMRGAQAERLLPATHAALAAAGVPARAVRRVICGAGPGSFTSMRIAASIAKGVALGAGASLHPVSSLLLVLAGAEPALEPGQYLVVLDALRDERFVAEARVGADGACALAAPPRLVAAAEVDDVATRAGATRVGPDEPLARWPAAHGVARLLATGAALAPVSLAAWEPDYGRLAEAQVKWEAAHGRPLSAS